MNCQKFKFTPTLDCVASEPGNNVSVLALVGLLFSDTSCYDSWHNYVLSWFSCCTGSTRGQERVQMLQVVVPVAFCFCCTWTCKRFCLLRSALRSAYFSFTVQLVTVQHSTSCLCFPGILVLLWCVQMDCCAKNNIFIFQILLWFGRHPVRTVRSDEAMACTRLPQNLFLRVFCFRLCTKKCIFPAVTTAIHMCTEVNVGPLAFRKLWSLLSGAGSPGPHGSTRSLLPGFDFIIYCSRESVLFSTIWEPQKGPARPHHTFIKI